MSYFLTPIRMAIIKLKNQKPRVDENVEKLEHLCITGIGVTWYNNQGKVLPGKVKNRITILSSNSTSGYIHRRTESRNME
jgi:hypothetical protein